MAQTLNFDIILGSSNAGLTLKAQLVDSTGTTVGSTVTSGFVEIGNGNYLWNYDSFPDSFQGGVIFYQTDDTLMAFTSINPNKLSPDGLDLIPVEDGVNLRQAMSIISAVLAGLISGNGTSTVVIKAINDPSTTRVTATISNTGDRSEVTLNLPG